MPIGGRCDSIAAGQGEVDPRHRPDRPPPPRRPCPPPPARPPEALRRTAPRLARPPERRARPAKRPHRPSEGLDRPSEGRFLRGFPRSLDYMRPAPDPARPSRDRIEQRERDPWTIWSETTSSRKRT